MADMFSLRGRVALVTGSSRGLGYAMAEALGRAGARVAINARDAKAVGEAVKQLKSAGIDAHARPFDATDEAAVKDAVAWAERDLGRLDIAVANAGTNIRKPIGEFDTATFEQLLRLHLTAGFMLAREASRAMVTRKFGRIIFTSSVTARIGRQTVAAYSAAKAGLEALVRQLTVELGPHGVTVNAIAPGYFLTELNKPLVANKEFNAYICQRTPIGRWADPKELGGPVVFLASDDAAFVTGQTIVVDGGLTIAF